MTSWGKIFGVKVAYECNQMSIYMKVDVIVQLPR